MENMQEIAKSLLIEIDEEALNCSKAQTKEFNKSYRIPFNLDKKNIKDLSSSLVNSSQMTECKADWKRTSLFPFQALEEFRQQAPKNIAKIIVNGEIKRITFNECNKGSIL